MKNSPPKNLNKKTKEETIGNIDRERVDIYIKKCSYSLNANGDVEI